MKRLFLSLFVSCFCCISIKAIWSYQWIRTQTYPNGGGIVRVSIETYGSWLIEFGNFNGLLIEKNYEDGEWLMEPFQAFLYHSKWGTSTDLEIKGILEDSEGFWEHSCYTGESASWHNNVPYIVEAKANEGYYFLGFSRSDYIYKDKNNGEEAYEPKQVTEPPLPYTYPESSFIFNTEIVQKNNPGYLLIPSFQYAVNPKGYPDWMRPDGPNERSFALFARVKVEDNEGGMASIVNHSDELSDITNDTGDVVSITATANDEMHPFVYWIEESTGRHITENPYTFTVNHQEKYIPFFDIESDVTNYIHTEDNITDNTYTIDGKYLDKTPQKGIYIKKNKKIVR